jgi:hypothetical protein
MDHRGDVIMRPISKEAQKVMDKLVEDLGPGNRHKRIDNAPGTFMAVVVEDIGGASYGNSEGYIGRLYSVAHYYTQNGDPMRDPEMVFWQGPHGEYFPVMYQQDNMGIYQESVAIQNGCIVGIRRKQQADQARFSHTWMRNIKNQQGLFARQRVPVPESPPEQARLL